MPGPYEYDIIVPGQIRLLRIRHGNDPAILEGELVTCRLLDEEEDCATPIITIQENDEVLVEAGDYDAVSYFWGNGDPTTHIVLYDRSNLTQPKGNLPIKPNLEAALKTFRRSLPPDDFQYFWIDAICINQANKPEKSAQIQRMALIYNQARQVRVWLGTATPDTTIAMNFVQDLLRLDDIDKLCNDDSTDFKWASFRELMRSEWFNRRWIIQEIALAREATLYCGEQMVSWEEFKWAVSLFISRQKALRTLFQQSRDFDNHPDYLGELEALGAKVLVDTSNDLFRKSESGEVIEHLLSLEALMSTLAMFEASTPHDTVYAILSLAHDAKPASSRPAALLPENARTPIGSPILPPRPGPLPTEWIPSINLMGGKLSTSPVGEHFPSPMPGESQTHSPAVPLAPDRAQQGSGSRSSGFLKPGEQGRSGRARTNSLNSLRRAERAYQQEPDPLQVDYEKSTYDVCKDFVEFVVRRSKSLDIICVPWAPSPSKEKMELKMPSWIPHISGRPFELRPHMKVYNRVAADPLVGTPGRGVRSYWACGKTKAHNVDAKNLIVDRALATYGFVLDVIERVGAEATGGIIPSSWLDLLGLGDSTEALPQNFWRTIVADRDVGGRKPPPAYFPLACKWAFARRARGFHLDTRQLLNEGRRPKEAARFLRRVQAVTWDRKLVLTKGTERADGTEQTPQLLALVPTTAREGDLICILHGCSVPVVLRKKEQSEAPEPGLKRKLTRQPTTRGNLKRRKTTMDSKEASRASGKPAEDHEATNMDPSAESDTVASGTSESNQANRTSSTSATANLRADSQSRVDTSSGISGPTNFSSQKVLEDQYTFLGACYVHGMMAGEAYKHREDTKTEYQEFWLV